MTKNGSVCRREREPCVQGKGGGVCAEMGQRVQ